MVLLWPVACVMGVPSNLSSVPLAVRILHQDTRRRQGFGVSMKRHRPGEYPADTKVRPIYSTLRESPPTKGLSRANPDAWRAEGLGPSARHTLSGAFGDAFHRIGDLPVPVLVIGCYQVGVAEDSVLVDVEPVEFLLGLDPDTNGRLERGEDGQRRDEDEAARRDDTEGLDAELVEATAVEQTGLADSGEGRGGEQTAGERAPDTAHTVRRYGAERVVDPDLIHVDQGGVHDDAGDEAYHDRSPGRDEGAGRGDGDEGRYSAVATHPDVHVTPVHVAHPHRAEDACRSGQVRRQGDVGDVGDGCHRRARVEAPPTDPEYEDAQDRERHVVARDGHGTAVVVVLTQTGTEEQGACERRHRAGEVDDRRAREVLHSELRQPAAAPDPVSHHRVDQAGEDDGEDYVDRELGPLQHRAPHDGQRNGAEGDLEQELGRERYLRPRESRVDVVYLAGRYRKEPALGADNSVARTEGQRETHGPEQESCDRQVYQYLGDHAPDVLHAGEANLEHREPCLHEKDQARRYDHPHRVHRQREIRRRRTILRERQPGQREHQQQDHSR